MRLMRRLNPRLKWVQSFAQQHCGRWGVVYQAANFLTLGEHMAKFYAIDGEIFHQKALTIKVTARRASFKSRQKAKIVYLQTVSYPLPR